MLQLIGSIVIGSLLLLGMITFYGDVTEYSNKKLFEELTQERTASLMEIIEYDFQRIGSGMNYPSEAIIDTAKFTFWADVNKDGTPDSVVYYTSISDSASATPNPNDVILYREVNGVRTIDAAEGVTGFTVDFLDVTGVHTTDLKTIRMLDVSLTMQSTSAYDTTYATAIWTKRIVPANLNRMTNINY